MEKIMMYCEKCKKEVEPDWVERTVEDVIQDDEWGRTRWATNYELYCPDCKSQLNGKGNCNHD